MDERYAFRFPRRAVAIPGIEREIAVLPKLAPLLPLPVPRPAFLGSPTSEYSWPFFDCELLPGVETADAALDDHARLEIAWSWRDSCGSATRSCCGHACWRSSSAQCLPATGTSKGWRESSARGWAGLDRGATD